MLFENVRSKQQDFWIIEQKSNKLTVECRHLSGFLYTIEHTFYVTGQNKAESIWRWEANFEKLKINKQFFPCPQEVFFLSPFGEIAKLEQTQHRIRVGE